MAVNFRGVPFHLVDNVDLIGATEKHLFIIDGQRWEIEEMEEFSYHQGASEGVANVDKGTRLLGKDSGGGQPKEGKP